MKYYQRIKEERQRKNMTQKQLAEAAQIAPGSVSAYEKGVKVPPVDAAYRIAKALCVNLDWLFNDQMTADEAKSAISSYGDIARQIVNICMQSINVRVSATTKYWREDIPYSEDDAIDFMQQEEIASSRGESKESVTVCIASIEIRDFRLSHFIESFGKLLDLYNEGTVEKEMLDAWLEKKLYELSSHPLPNAYDFSDNNESDKNSDS